MHDEEKTERRLLQVFPPFGDSSTLLNNFFLKAISYSLQKYESAAKTKMLKLDAIIVPKVSC